MKPIAVFLAGLLPLLAATTPINRRAGAPNIVPVPDNCTVINPLPHAICGDAGVDSVSGLMPNTNFTATHLIWSYYYDRFLNHTYQYAYPPFPIPPSRPNR